MRGTRQARIRICLGLAASASATVYFQESFADGWDSKWVTSGAKDAKELGEFKHVAPKLGSDDKGIKTGEDARFYQISAKMDSPINNKGKTLVVQYSVQHEQDLDCGGAYIKLLEDGLDQSKFGGDSEYKLMFGPDICGTGTRRTHAILSYDKKSTEGKLENFLHTKNIKVETDTAPHLYTMILKADDTYDVKIDGKSVQDGKISENWEMLHAKKIKDPAQSKPKDWVDDKMISDPEDKKPEGWDDIPKQLPDPEASKPDDWDDEDDGEWEAPMVDNKEYKGEFKAKQIENPAYKGEWEHPEIDNPDYKEDSELHARCENCNYVGFELWQVKAGTIFDDIFITDSEAEAEAEAKKFEEKVAAYKKAKEAADAEAKAKAEEEAAKKKVEDEKKKAEEDAKKEADADAKEDDEEDKKKDEKKDEL